MKNNKIRKLLATVLTFSIAFSCVSVGSFSFSAIAEDKITTKTVSESPLFDENNIVTRIGVLSDVHQNGVDGSPAELRFRKAIQTLYTKADGKLDGISISGDLGEYNFSIDMPQFKKVLDEEIKGDTKVTFALGNHDAGAGDIDLNTGLNKYRELLADYYAYDEADSVPSRECRHTIIDGYSFLSLYTKDYYGDTPVKFDEQDKKWLDDQLKKITEKDPNRYVFLSIHPIIRDTVYAEVPNNRWSTTNLDDIIKKYPQLVTLGGHVHQDIQDERAIWQGDFTAIQVPSLANLYIENPKFDEINKNYNKVTDTYSAGLYFEFDKNGAIRINRLDFLNNRVIKEPWVIPSPKADKSHLSYYTNEGRIAKNTAPTFGDSPALGIIDKGNFRYGVYMKSATDDDMVYYYDIITTNLTTGVVTKTNMLSKFYMYADMSRIPTEYTKDIGTLVKDNEYKIEVIAYDTWLTPSETLSKTFVAKESTMNPENLKADLFNAYFSLNNSVFDVSPTKHPIQGGTALKTGVNSDLKTNAATFTSQKDEAFKFTLNKKEKDSFKDSFALDFYFKNTGDGTKNGIILSTGNVESGGINIYIGTDKRMHFELTIGGKNISIKTKNMVSTQAEYHFILSYNGNDLKLYTNGSDDSSVYGISGDVKLPEDSVTFAIGGSLDAENNVVSDLNGILGKMRLFSHEMSVLEAKELYKSRKEVEEPEYVLGDVDSNGVISTMDVLMILKHLAKMEPLTGNQILAANYNQDDVVSTLDAIAILRKIANLD